MSINDVYQAILTHFSEIKLKLGRKREFSLIKPGDFDIIEVSGIFEKNLPPGGLTWRKTWKNG